MYTASIQDDRYGITGTTVKAEDITTSRDKINELVDLLNRNEVSEIHFFEVLEDWLGQ